MCYNIFPKIKITREYLHTGMVSPHTLIHLIIRSNTVSNAIQLANHQISYTSSDRLEDPNKQIQRTLAGAAGRRTYKLYQYLHSCVCYCYS